MPHLRADDGTKLHYEESGSGTPIVFVHEFAGDWRTWEPQVRHFSRRYRCIAYNARGYPPSDVPADVGHYSQQRARDDILAVLDGLGIERAHIVGNSMGGFAALHFGMAYSPRALSLVVAGCGYGAHPDQYENFQQRTRDILRVAIAQGMKPVVFGIVAGLAGAAALARYLETLLFEVKPADPFTYAAMAAVVAAIALAACTMPALRAARIDPAAALRD